jgi:hypothetical protein
MLIAAPLRVSPRKKQRPTIEADQACRCCASTLNPDYDAEVFHYHKEKTGSGGGPQNFHQCFAAFWVLCLGPCLSSCTMGSCIQICASATLLIFLQL